MPRAAAASTIFSNFSLIVRLGLRIPSHLLLRKKGPVPLACQRSLVRRGRQTDALVSGGNPDGTGLSVSRHDAFAAAIGTAVGTGGDFTSFFSPVLTWANFIWRSCLSAFQLRPAFC